MRLILVAMIILVVLLAGCAQQIPGEVTGEKPSMGIEVAEPQDIASADNIADVDEEPEVAEDLIIEDGVEEDSSYDFDSLSSAEKREIRAIREKIDKALSKEPNYFYRYTGPDQYQYEYWVKGDNMRIQVIEPKLLNKDVTKNIVYLDRAKETASWYCWHDNMEFCYSGEGPWPADFLEFFRKTPHDWLEELGQDFLYKFDDRIQGYTYNIIDYEKDGKLVRVWLHSWLGLPMQIEFHPDLDPESEPDAVYKFDDMKTGELKDADVTP